MRPLIAVTMSVGPGRTGVPERATINTAYLRALEVVAAVPLLVPAQAGGDSLERLLAGATGLILTGGGDIEPARYGEEPHPATDGVSPQRDATELHVLRLALERGLPVLAICRGMQLLNVALGGTLCQDLPSQRGLAIAHAQQGERGEASHGVSVAPRSRLRALLGGEDAVVNSMHHQGIARLAPGLVAAAWAEDGLIEGVEVPGERLVVGVQWHPEELMSTAGGNSLLAGFVAAASTAQHGSSVSHV